jgi:hypothetical protein
METLLFDALQCNPDVLGYSVDAWSILCMYQLLLTINLLTYGNRLTETDLDYYFN